MSDAAHHKDRLVRTAMRLFRKQGYSSTGLQQILAEADAPKGSLYYYFPGGKEQLGEAAVTLAGQMIAQMLKELASQHQSTADFVSAYCATMAGWMEESGFRSGCPIATTMLENAPHAPALTQAGNVAIDSWVDIIASVLGRDEPLRDVARERAEQLVARMEGALLLARIRQSTGPILRVANSF